jgi:hypothetical protein
VTGVAHVHKERPDNIYHQKFRNLCFFMLRQTAQKWAAVRSTTSMHGAYTGGECLEENATCPNIATLGAFIAELCHELIDFVVSPRPSLQITAMAPKILVILVFLAVASPAALAAFDVIEMLADKPTYSTFLKLLQDTKVAGEANQLRSATLLVVPDKLAKPLASLPADKVRPAVENHVLLSYFDPIKLDEMKTRTAILPTLLSVTDKKLGVLNYTRADDGQMYFGAPGAPCVAKLVKVVAARPYSVSIMEISEPILPAALPSPVAAPGRRGKGGKRKIKPSAATHEDSNMIPRKPVEAVVVGKGKVAKDTVSESPAPSPAPVSAP